jgi:excinuclease ABC subunit A
LIGHEHISDVIDIDQSPIGRSSRSNPATYIGFYDTIRTLFAETEDARRRGFSASTFSFNVKGGRCEECTGEGSITTQLSFMPDVEVVCPTCKGARYHEETLEVKYHGKSIADVLDMSIEDGVVLRTRAGHRTQDQRPQRTRLGYLKWATLPRSYRAGKRSVSNSLPSWAS